MNTLTLHDGEAAFEALVHRAEAPERVVLFAVGGGGDPGRHEQLLAAIVARGWSLVAPRSERLTTPRVDAELLERRAQRLRFALDVVAPMGVPCVGIGHSIGGTTLLALAGARAWTGPERPVLIEPDSRLRRVAAMAPPTGFFRVPRALDGLRGRHVLYGASRDERVSIDQLAFFRDAPNAEVEVRVAEGAGHFSFMDRPPPNIVEPLPDRDAFLVDLRDELITFVERALDDSFP
ncbi:MAG: hypothetical protein H6722_22930 [Sandaracinus sp.]|nr:hypothetical protein [Sandaracinus sp.]MCB9615298.1 hypothetical protein [Sandaracinus sp.]